MPGAPVQQATYRRPCAPEEVNPCPDARRCRAQRRWYLAAVALLAAPMTTAAADPPSYQFTGPVFGLATAPSGALVVADAGSGVVTLRKAGGRVMAKLPNVTDMAPIGLSST